MGSSSSTSRFWRERVLITVKTYPTPHPTHHEAVCTAGINEAGEWRRLWPIPFRHLEKGRQFRRYEWIDVALRKQSGDTRPESHVVDPETIVPDGFIPAGRHWGARRAILVPHAAASVEELQDRRAIDGTSMGFLRPKSVARLELIWPKSSAWSVAQEAQTRQQQLRRSAANRPSAPCLNGKALLRAF